MLSVGEAMLSVGGEDIPMRVVKAQHVKQDPWEFQQRLRSAQLLPYSMRAPLMMRKDESRPSLGLKGKGNKGDLPDPWSQNPHSWHYMWRCVSASCCHPRI